jgi:hypothetical protein
MVGWPEIVGVTMVMFVAVPPVMVGDDMVAPEASIAPVSVGADIVAPVIVGSVSVASVVRTIAPVPDDVLGSMIQFLRHDVVHKGSYAIW